MAVRRRTNTSASAFRSYTWPLATPAAALVPQYQQQPEIRLARGLRPQKKSDRRRLAPHFEKPAIASPARSKILPTAA